MGDLIKALQIFNAYMYEEVYAPTNCSHDVFAVCCVPFEVVSMEDVEKLNKLGFFWSKSDSVWQSFRFGSC